MAAQAATNCLDRTVRIYSTPRTMRLTPSTVDAADFTLASDLGDVVKAIESPIRFRELNFPGANDTIPMGVWRNVIVGEYAPDPSNVQSFGFEYDQSSF